MMNASKWLGRLLAVGCAAFLGISRVQSCHILVPSEHLSGCRFDPLTIEVPATGFTISRDTCNEFVDKMVFHDQPYVQFARANEDKVYMLLMVDLENVERPDEFYLHWIMVNIPGYIMKRGYKYGYGEPIIMYEGPDPQAFSGQHNYMLLAYEQISDIRGIPIPAFRSKFSPTEWFDSFGGDDVVSGPVASIGFISEY